MVEATDEEKVLLVVEPVELEEEWVEEEWVLVGVLVVDDTPKGSGTVVGNPAIMLLITPPAPAFEVVVVEVVVGLLPPLVLIQLTLHSCIRSISYSKPPSPGDNHKVRRSFGIIRESLPPRPCLRKRLISSASMKNKKKE